MSTFETRAKAAGGAKNEKKIVLYSLLKMSVCSICLETVSKTNVEWLPCCHSFHKTCIDKWLEKKHSCPTCRKNPFPSNQNEVLRHIQGQIQDDENVLFRFVMEWLEVGSQEAEPIEAEVYDENNHNTESISNYYSSENAHVHITFDPSQIVNETQ